LLPFPQGLGVEIGGGHNQLLWRVAPIPAVAPATDYPRQEFSLTPTLRLHYASYPFVHVQFLPFIGYNQFGGRSPEESNGYKDEFWIHSVEVGLIGAYAIGDILLGLGAKHNRHVSMRHRFYGTLYQITARSWQEEEESIFFKNYSSSLGMRASWEYHHWSISGEAWFGVSNLEKDDLDSFIDIREQHFRVLLGYTL
jgi:hypothetical protein